jgi:ribosome modulation factor
LDIHGNVTQVNNYNWGSLNSPLRTYNDTYLNSSNYTNLHICHATMSAIRFSWLGGWTQDRLCYLVMAVKIQRPGARPTLSAGGM